MSAEPGSLSAESSSLKVTLFNESRKAPPTVFVFFGATGDLAARKIAPALYNLRRDGGLGEDVAVVGVARRERSDEAFRQEMLAAIRQHGRLPPVDEPLWRRFAGRWHYRVVDAGRREQYADLAGFLKDLAGGTSPSCNLVIYLATTPETWPAILEGLGAAGLNRPLTPGAAARVVVEKPFGHDLESGRRLNAQLRGLWEERRIFRIDHYLGKETVRNVLVLRFANAIFEPLLHRRYVHHVELTTAETAGMEGRRGAYYDRAGALRDMVQSHMLQLLALLAMECPASADPEAIRDGKVALLRVVRSLSAAEVPRRTVRGQYAGDADAPAYRQEAGVAPDSQTETYAASRLDVDNERWAGVPFYLRTGKQLAAKASYVAVQFRREVGRLFEGTECDMSGPNRLVIRIAPEEGAFFVANAKVPGDRMLLRPVRLAFDYRSSFESASPEAYERLLLDAMCGDGTLFLREDEVAESWRIVDAVRKVWDNGAGPELMAYLRGSWGPGQADQIFGDPYRRWYNLEAR